LYIKATISQSILVASNYPVAIVSMICLCQSVVNGLQKAASGLFAGGKTGYHMLATAEIQEK
jgi:hypothetical protein